MMNILRSWVVWAEALAMAALLLIWSRAVHFKMGRPVVNVTVITFPENKEE